MIKLQGPSKDQAVASCIQSLLSKNAIERVENVKSLRFYSRLFLSTQASPKVEASNRPKQAQHLPTCRKFQNGNTRVHQDLSDSRGNWVSSIDLLDAYLHIPIQPNSRKYLRFCHKSQVFQFTSLPFGLATAPQVFTMIVKKVKLMEESDFTSTWTTGLSGPSLRKKHREHSDNCRSDPVLRVDKKSREI